MTSRFVLDELDLDFPTACLLVALGLVLVLVLVPARLAGVVVLDERVVADGLGREGVWVGDAGAIGREVSALAFAHVVGSCGGHGGMEVERGALFTERRRKRNWEKVENGNLISSSF